MARLIVASTILLLFLSGCETDVELSTPQEKLVAECLQLAFNDSGAPLCLEVTAGMERAFLKKHPTFIADLQAQREASAAAQAQRDAQYASEWQARIDAAAERKHQEAQKREQEAQAWKLKLEALKRERQAKARQSSLHNCGEYALDGAQQCAPSDTQCNARVRVAQLFSGGTCQEFSEREIKQSVERVKVQRAQRQADEARARAAAAKAAEAS